MAIHHCTECKHFSPNNKTDLRFGFCKHPQSERKRQGDRLTEWYVCGAGDIIPEDITWSFASTMRQYGCGYEGKLFEPKEEAKA